MGDVIEYSDVVQENRGAMHPGRLKLLSSSVIFKNIKTGRVDTFQSTDLEKATWLQRARGHCLKLILNNGTIHRFDGLKESDFDKLSKFMSSNYDVQLAKQDISYKGWNWGVCDFVGNGLEFLVSEKLGFEVPLNNVSNSMTGKNEVTLEFHQNDDANVSLMELRFYIPPGTGAEEEDPVENFCKKVLEKADIIQATGEAIAIFSELQCLTPRGRYDIKIFPSFLQLHGKTFDYKIPFTTILRLFLLPHRDQRQMFFVVSLDPPIKQGQTRYPFLIMLFNNEDETTLELSLTEEELAEKYEGRLQKEMSGKEFEVVSRIMKTFVNRKITVPGSFLGNTGTQSIACSYKAATGFLYPLERGFIFIHKPPLHVRFDEVAAVNFGRSAGNTRSFDFDIETKTGTVLTFVGIEKDEYGKLYEFVTEKKLRVKNIGGGAKGKTYNDDFGDSDDEGQHDAYMERMKREGKTKVVDDDDDEDDSTDESYHLPDDGSEVAEEWDSEYSSSNSDEDYEAPEGGGGGAGGTEEAGGSEEEDKAEERRLAKERRDQKKAKKEQKKKESGEGGGVKRKRRTKKAERDEDRPKRPKSSYFLWLGDQREKIKEENPGISITEISKKAGEMWRATSAEDKIPYEDQAKIEKEKYVEAMVEYNKKIQDRDEDDGDKGDEASPTSKKTKATKTKSPKKVAAVTSTFSGGSYKSKEFIEDSDSDSDASDKPLKKKKKEESDEEPAKDSDDEAAKESDDEAAKESDKEAEKESDKEAEKESDDEPAKESEKEHSASEKESDMKSGKESGSE